MKPLQNQYQDLLEGKMSKFNFLNNIKRSLPDLVSNVTSFDDAVKILKNRRILSEVQVAKEVFNPAAEDALEKIVSKYVKDADDIDKEMEAYHNQGYQGFSDMLKANLSRDNDFNTWVEYTKDKEQYKKEVGESKLNEDWGSSDQNIMNKAIHDELGQPESMPMPFDKSFESAIESAVDDNWSEWEEYKSDREGLIDHAKKAYYRSYFPEKFAAFQEMFSEAVSPESQDRMDSLVNKKHINNILSSAEGVVKDLRADGFDDEDIFDYIVDIIKRGKEEEDIHALPGAKEYYEESKLNENVDLPANLIADIDKVNPLEYRTGLDYELDLSGDFSAEGLEKAVIKVLKNLKKDAIYYTNLKAELTSKINKKQVEAAKSVEVKKDNKVDKLNQVKTLVKKELANTKITLGKQEKVTRATPEGVKLMKEERDVEARYNEYVDKLSHGTKANIEKQWKEAGDDMVKKHKVVVRAKELAKIKEYVSHQLKKEAVKFTVAGDNEYKNPKDAVEFEKDLKAAGVKYTKSNV